tara:strand:+ start:7755 stop:7934 length:180 start_codon:yes stop_codon:yes gene_type:complete
VISRAIMAVGTVQMGLAIYMGYFIPKEYHHFFAFSARDFFLISFVAFAFGLHGVLRGDK